jgi:hypothetical protein
MASAAVPPPGPAHAAARAPADDDAAQRLVSGTGVLGSAEGRQVGGGRTTAKWVSAVFMLLWKM